MDYRALQWRKRLERRGWINLRRGIPPQHLMIEYHVIWQGWLFSGRCQLNATHPDDHFRPGSERFLLARQFEITEGVWRRARNQAGELGQTVRKW